MAITTASFVPEERAGNNSGGGGGAAPAGASAHGPGAGPMNPHGAAPTHDGAHMAMHETMPATHPLSGTPLPAGTGSGQGTVRKGGPGGR